MQTGTLQYKNYSHMFESMIRSVMVESMKHVFTIAALLCSHNNRNEITVQDIQSSLKYHMISPNGVGSSMSNAFDQIIKLETGEIEEFSENPLLIQSVNTIQDSLNVDTRNLGPQASGRRSAEWVMQQLFETQEFTESDSETDSNSDSDSDSDSENLTCNCNICTEIQNNVEIYNKWEPQTKWQIQFYNLIQNFQNKLNDSEESTSTET